MAEHRKKQNIFRTFASVIISFAFAGYIYLHRHPMITAFKGINTKYIALVVISQIAAQLANAGLLRVSISSFVKNLKMTDAFKITLAASSINFFTPVVGGISAKAIYLKRKHQLSYALFTSVIYANYLIAFLFSFLSGTLGLIVLHHGLRSRATQVATLFFGGGIILCLVFMLFSHKLTRQLHRINFKNNVANKIIQKMLSVNEGWETIRNNKKMLINMSAWTGLAMVCTVSSYVFVMKSLNIHSAFGAILIFAALGNVSLLFNITPGNVGIRETIYASTYSITGINLQTVVAFSLLERTTLILFLGVAWVVFGRKIISEAGRKLTIVT